MLILIERGVSVWVTCSRPRTRVPVLESCYSIVVNALLQRQLRLRLF